ncbi:A C2HC-type zinc-finger protein (macronuclear) [Tetrahymena thermophila SB210]|uniref:A C2HC-type zinc-finger protein n=1 Tax=Tetrahymena thermophila (strain SB210) TaxID=312017 RepID=Q247Z8_TETTS|nr:A C2HC-type zinc-finger protein [Tetrahymena thermophila SB210]EAS04147.2 A C2HC-type zinc-finger protein [Tetrahymena thermophila SB210]|eukprot:XP_001024392.2 A C2HC-type zinc-finger protein [Tetrahymena thermophila SB210]
MNSSNNNWKMGNERRVNLAMTAELALNGNAGSKNISNMQYNPSVQGGAVPRVRGAGMESNLNTNDILGTYKMQGGNGIGNSSKGFGYSEENKDLTSGYKPSQVTTGLPPRGYNSNNDYNSFNTGLSTNNNINNQYKPTGMGADGFGNFQTTSSNSSIQAESNGFKVQRVRGTQQGGPTAINNQNFQGTQAFGGGNTQNNQVGQGTGYGLARNNSRKDENADIDQQTRQLKLEIDSLDLKLGQKNSATNGSSNNFYQNNEQQNNAFKSSATNFGSNNNINTGFTGSGKNFYSNNNNSDSNSNQFNSTATGAGNSVYGNNGFGISFGNANNNNNNMTNNNNFDNFGAMNLNNVQSSSPKNFNSTLQSNQLNLTQNSSTNNNNNRLPPRGRPPVGPSANNNFEDTFGVKTDNNQQNEVRKIPVNLENLNSQNKNTNSTNNNNNTNSKNNNETKEFSTGTYDPSNILNQNRQGRMRSLGKKDANINSHEEKAAQATGSKNIPDQEPEQEQFQCPEGCGRKFNKNALAKHIPQCKKHFQPKKEDQKPQEQQKMQQDAVQHTAEAKKQVKPPKQASKKPGSKDQKSRPEQKDSNKNEALRKLKEQKKKELMQQNKEQEKGDDELVDEPNHNEYL